MIEGIGILVLFLWISGAFDKKGDSGYEAWERSCGYIGSFEDES